MGEARDRARKRELTGIGAVWQARHASRIKVGSSASSLEGNETDEMMDEAYDDELAPLPSAVHVSITLEQARAHFDAVMAEELQVLQMSVF